jgi:hypothetical protein
MLPGDRLKQVVSENVSLQFEVERLQGYVEEMGKVIRRLRRIEAALQDIAGIQSWGMAPNHQYALGRQEEADRLGDIARAALAHQPIEPWHYHVDVEPTVERPDWTHEKEVLADDSAN